MKVNLWCMLIGSEMFSKCLRRISNKISRNINIFALTSKSIPSLNQNWIFICLHFHFIVKDRQRINKLEIFKFWYYDKKIFSNWYNSNTEWLVDYLCQWKYNIITLKYWRCDLIFLQNDSREYWQKLSKWKFLRNV